MPRHECVSVFVDDGAESACYCIKIHEYARIKQAMLDLTPAFLELTSIFGDGKLFVPTKSIVHLFYAPESYCEAHDDYDRQQEILKSFE